MFKKIIIDGETTRWSVDETGRVRNDESGKFLKGSILGGYRYINFRWNHKNKNRGVHRLVAEAFLPNPDNLPYVHHIDANPLNNCVENLRWVTVAENRQEAPHPKGYTKYGEEVIIEGEEWRTFRNSVYQVSNLGRVRNTKTGKTLKCNPSKNDGYVRVCIQLPCEARRKYLVHLLVYECFVSKTFDVINHIDGNKSNNCVENLESVTQKENMRKAATETNAWNFRKVIQYDLNGNKIAIHANASEAARAVGILPSSMRNAIRLRQGRTQGYIFKYIELEETSSTILEGSRSQSEVHHSSNEEKIQSD